jgi:glutamate formiminotransferase / formiminotetrahydrofolate cyclodeaminase
MTNDNPTTITTTTTMPTFANLFLSLSPEPELYVMSQLIECVPNFSEGRNPTVIEQIAEVIRQTEGVKLLNIDPGKATNRTVITFTGEPERVVEAAFQAIRKAAELIDMKNHHGEHPRFGATDVCPLVPLSGITMEETVEWARKLAKRVGEELGIPVYCYEYAASRPERVSLADCRAGEYEGLQNKLTQLDWKPDYGPSS